MTRLKTGACAATVGVALFAIVTGGVCQSSQPRICVKRVVAMEYPSFARAGRIQGRVVLTVRISSAGGAPEVRVVSGAVPLAAAAVDTLSRWQFGGCENKDNGCEIEIAFSFLLSGTCTVGAVCPTEFVADLPDAVEVKSGVWDGPIVEGSKH